jgi:Sec-independent protein translocase protein TatA
MGGIAIDDSVEPCTPADHPPKLTEAGVALLLQLEPDLLPDIPADELNDKSKGNSLTKTLACLQATWFCIACLARVIQGLPLSLFELNTFTHAVCTVIVYVIWWKKPLDVERPLLIKDNRSRPLLAYMWMASKTSARAKIKRKGDTSYTVGQDPEFEAIDYLRKPPGRSAINARQRDIPSVSTQEALKITEGTCLPGTDFYVNAASTRWTVEASTTSGDEYNVHTSTHTYKEPAVFTLKTHDIRRWRLGQQALETHALAKPTKDQNLITVKPVPEFVNLSSGRQDMIEQGTPSWLVLGFAVVASCYGALHALAWNARFPNRKERILWRVSSLVIASPAGVWLLVVVIIFGLKLLSRLAPWIVKTAKRVKNWVLSKQLPTDEQTIASTEASAAVPTISKLDKKQQQSRISRFWKLCWYCVTGLASLLSAVFIFLYFPARAYIVGESFRMVFYLPPAAFQSTSWENYLPHLG